VKVTAEIVVNEYSDPETVRARVNDALRTFISPLDITRPNSEPDELLGKNWQGWPFGRALFVSELYTLIQRVAGVKHVLDVKLSQRAVVPNKETPLRDSVEVTALPTEPPPPPELRPVDGRRLTIPSDTLLVSLEHDIVIAEL
jgi:hypothetical protein